MPAMTSATVPEPERPPSALEAHAKLPGTRGLGSGAQAVCWLKAAIESYSANACRVAGDVGSPGGLALRPAINGKFTFLTGL